MTWEIQLLALATKKCFGWLGVYNGSIINSCWICFWLDSFLCTEQGV